MPLFLTDRQLALLFPQLIANWRNFFPTYLTPLPIGYYTLTFLSLHRSVLALRARLRDASFPAIKLRARGTGLYWFSNDNAVTLTLT